MATLTDLNGAPCPCGSTRRTYSYRYVRQSFDSGYIATLGCCECKLKRAVDVAPEVPRLVVTVEQRRAWWGLV